MFPKRGESLSKIISAILSAYLWKNIYMLLWHNNKSNLINFRWLSWEVLLSMLLTSYYIADEVNIIEKQYNISKSFYKMKKIYGI